MRPDVALRHEFVRAIPDDLEERTVYVSIDFATVAHKCLCGCGSEVVTPLTPTDWRLTFDGETVSLDPSVGSWQLPCQSHYWIRRNRAHWSRQWSREQIEAGREADALAKARYYESDITAEEVPPVPVPCSPVPHARTDRESSVGARRTRGVWRRLKGWLFGQ